MDRQRHSDVAGSIACNVIRVVEERDQRPFNVEVAHSRHLVDKQTSGILRLQLKLAHDCSLQPLHVGKHASHGQHLTLLHVVVDIGCRIVAVSSAEECVGIHTVGHKTLAYARRRNRKLGAVAVHSLRQLRQFVNVFL